MISTLFSGFGALSASSISMVMLLVKATTIGLWVVTMIWLSARQGFGAPAAYTAFFVLLTVSGGALAWRFTAALERSPQKTLK